MKEQAKQDKVIYVEATQTGFFGHKRIKAGQQFKLSELKIKKSSIDPKTKKKIEHVETVSAEQQFSALWMEKIDGRPSREDKPMVEFQQNDNVEAVVI